MIEGGARATIPRRQGMESSKTSQAQCFLHKNHPPREKKMEGVGKTTGRR